MKGSLLEQCDLVPPFVVRRLARKRGRALNTMEIAKASGLSVATVKRYARLRSWSTVPIARAQAFASACGHDLLRPNRNIKYLKWSERTGRGFGYLGKEAKRRFAKLL